jgi:hypothetical protein
MTRTALLQLTIVILLVCAAVTALLWWYVQQAEIRLQQLNSTRDAKQTELANLSQMTEAQAKLDGLTLDERETTQLALLRHLELENVPLNFQVMSREARPSGDTTLITRAISLQLVDTYSTQMALLDQLFGNGKIQIHKVTMMRSENPEIADPVDMNIEGVIYSLEKNLETQPVLQDVTPVVASPAVEAMISPTGADIPNQAHSPEDAAPDQEPVLPHVEADTPQADEAQP